MDLAEDIKRVHADNNRHPWELARLKIVEELIGNLITKNEENIILDIGCGDSFVVESLARIYPKSIFFAVDTAFGKELLDYYSQKIQAGNIKLYSRLEDATPDIYKKITLVLLLDVIEHIDDDVKFLQDLQKHSQIDGNTFLLITVPAFQTLFCSHDHFLGHYRRYTNQLLKANVAKSGLTPVMTGYFFFCLLPVRILEVIKEKIFRIKPAMTTGLVEWKGSKAVSRILKNILWMDYKISSLFKQAEINIIGLSNYMICKRSV